jgi:hypothetical protein
MKVLRFTYWCDGAGWEGVVLHQASSVFCRRVRGRRDCVRSRDRVSFAVRDPAACYKHVCTVLTSVHYLDLLASVLVCATHGRPIGLYSISISLDSHHMLSTVRLL